jgi:hypothetical protein
VSGVDGTGIEETGAATQVEDAPRAPGGRPHCQRPRSQSEELPGPDDDADRRRAHEVHLTQVDHDIGVARDRPGQGLRQGTHGGDVVLAAQPDDGVSRVAPREIDEASTSEGDGQ